MTRVTFLLPARERFVAPSAASSMARCLRRGDTQQREAGADAQFERHVRVLPQGPSMAAISRQFDCGDAAGFSWLRADPAVMQADMTTGRLIAHGDLGLAEADVAALLKPLKPLFGDEGFPISSGRGNPAALNRWYLQLPVETELPELVDPGTALGADLGDCLPAGSGGRRWRRLFSEAQIILHNHPLNQRRREAGLQPVNGLWFWGGGRLPDSVALSHRHVVSDDESLHWLAQLAGQPLEPVEAFEAMIESGRMDADWLLDLRHRRDAAKVVEAAMPSIQRNLADAQLTFDFADGQVTRWRRGHRWRVWRR